MAVSDGRGGEIEQTYTLVTETDTTLPVVSLTVTDTVLKLGDELGLQAFATDNDALADLIVTVDGTPVALNGSGIAYLNVARSGFIPVVATARDRSGNIGTATQTIRVTNPADQSFPTVTIDSAPLEAVNGIITTATDISGTVTDDGLEYWKLEMAPMDLVNTQNLTEENPAFKLIAQGTANVSGHLGRIDPTVLANGSYYLRLTGGDVSGNIRTSGYVIEVTGNLKLGRVLLPVTDLTIPVAGIPITVTRVYDSLEAGRKGDFGYGWSLALQNARITESVPVDPYEAAGTSYAYRKTFRYGTRVTLLAPDGRRIGFTFQPKIYPSSALFGDVYFPYWQPDPGVYEKLDTGEAALTLNPDGSVTGYLFNLIYNPDTYTLTTKDGTKYRYNQFRGLETITNRNGNVLTFSATGIRTTTGAEVKFQRDASGRITSITDPQGGIIHYTYNAAGELDRVTDQAGRYTSFGYFETPAHYLNQILDPLGNPISITNYDGQGRLSTVSDAMGNITGIVYDEANRTETQTDPLGGVTINTYDERGNLLVNINPVGAISASTFDSNNNPLTVTPPCGCSRTFTYDSRGNQLTNTDARGNITSMVYDQNNLPVSRTDALGNTIRNTFDAQGNITSTVDPEGKRTTFASDEFARPTSITNSLNHVIRMEYAASDESGVIASRPSVITMPDNGTFRITYDMFGKIASAQDPTGSVQTLETDPSGKLLRKTDGLGQTSTYSYNDRGELSSATDAAGQVTYYEFDLRGSLIKRTDPNGTITSFAWDKLGRHITTTDPLGRVTSKYYRADSALEKIKQPDSTEIKFEYDISGRRTALIDPNGNRTTFQYNSINQLTAQKDAFNRVTTCTFDAASNLTSITDRLGRVRKFTYDTMNRRIKEVWLSPGSEEIVKTISFTYDALGNRESVSDDFTTLGYQYDSRSRIVQQSATYDEDFIPSPFVLQFNHDEAARVLTAVDGDGVSVSRYFDERLQLKRLVWTGSGAFLPARIDFTRNSVGDLTQITRFTDVQGTQLAMNTAIEYGQPQKASSFIEEFLARMGQAQFPGRDLLGPGANGSAGSLSATKAAPYRRVARITHSNSAEVLEDFQYTYDATERLASETSRGDTTTYAYDNNGQVISGSKRFQTQASETFAYDSSGNRTSSSKGNSTTTYSVGVNNQILTDSTYTYTYDAEGNLTVKRNISTGESMVYDYDHRNRLLSALSVSSDGVTQRASYYLYDPLDRRIAKTVQGQTTKYLYNGVHIWKEIAPAGEVTRFLHGEGYDQWLARQRSSNNSSQTEVAWYLSDRLGTVRSMASRDGTTLLSRSEYSSFGSREYVGSGTDSLAFTGRELDDDTGLYYYRARYYDPALGTFISEDPMGFKAGDYILNRYCFNNPINYVDPTGHGIREYLSRVTPIGMAVQLGAGTLTAIYASGQYMLHEHLKEEADRRFSSSIPYDERKMDKMRHCFTNCASVSMQGQVAIAFIFSVLKEVKDIYVVYSRNQNVWSEASDGVVDMAANFYGMLQSLMADRRWDAVYDSCEIRCKTLFLLYIGDARPDA
ncbi:hypothetical protein DB346_07750 [Verrucomicrobia bacterium LW23]|nr:hypothetical protein DB346_07750 [Verrucomicrobia bacterium LW23]